ncbi:unnamed protein product [Mytilus edulis]|uniref:Uncharacterized protein n=1 Tax=Mytilus edulis TaxID=6550 RepID=A0A8S3SXX6_MYTED|nr:unnamed protein product [Mytilus edulis]
MKNAYRLHNTRYGIKQQFPKEIEDRRKKLYPIMKEAKYNRRNVKLVRDRLYIDNELYEIHDDIDTFDGQGHLEERNDATPETNIRRQTHKEIADPRNGLARAQPLQDDRNSMDKGKNRYGNQLLELFKCNSLFIMNGRLATDIAGKFTCRNASVVDYCLCNVNFIKNIISLNVLEFSHLYSDVHCPLFICLNCNQSVKESIEQNNFTSQSNEKVNKWDHEKKPEFRENLNFEKLHSLLHDLVNVNLESINDDMINSFVDEIGLILIESARKL